MRYTESYHSFFFLFLSEGNKGNKAWRKLKHFLCFQSCSQFRVPTWSCIVSANPAVQVDPIFQSNVFFFFFFSDIFMKSHFLKMCLIGMLTFRITPSIMKLTLSAKWQSSFETSCTLLWLLFVYILSYKDYRQYKLTCTECMYREMLKWDKEENFQKETKYIIK